MKVQCGQCPAKYAVSDDRIRGKKVRIHCKRCGASIVVDGKVVPPLVTSTPERRSVRPAAARAGTSEDERAPDSLPAPRPIAHTIVGGLEAPSAERRSTSEPHISARPDAPWAALEAPRLQPEPHRGHTDPPPGPEEGRWRVALTKQDLRWMTTDEVVEAYRSGAVKLETFVFRSSMPTWVTLLEVPELADALADANQEGDDHGAERRVAARREPSLGAGAALAGDASAGGEALAPAPPEGAPEQGAREPLAAGPAAATDGASAPASPRAAPAQPVGGSRSQEAPPALAELARPEALPGPSPVAAVTPTPAPPPFALAQPSEGPGRWLVWAVVVLLLTGAAAALLGPSIGLELF